VRSDSAAAVRLRQQNEVDPQQISTAVPLLARRAANAHFVVEHIDRSEMRKSFSRPSCCVAILLCSLVPTVCAESILGFAVMAGLSHQLNILRIGQELAVRGHNFSMLLSSTDTISIDAIKKGSFPGLDVVTFGGPVHVGTEAWASSLSRDPQEVAH